MAALPDRLPAGGGPGGFPLQPPRLRERWRVVVVVTPQSAAQAGATIASARANSLGGDLRVLSVAHDDCRAVLEPLSLPVEYALPDDLSAGRFWLEVIAASIPGDAPVLYLPAGILVPHHWDARLVAAGQTADAVAIAPLSAGHALLGAFQSPDHVPGLPVDAVDQWLNEYASAVTFVVPALLPGCLLVQPDSCWAEALAAARSDDDLLQALHERGLSVQATDSVYVDDTACPHIGAEVALPAPCIDGNRQQPGLAALRHALTELSERRSEPPALQACLPMQLHIGHSWGGGLERWMEDFVAADPHHDHLVLRSVGDLEACGRRIGLYRSTAMDVPLRSWQLRQPIFSISGGSAEYRAIIRSVVDEFRVESLVVSSLVGHSLDLLRTGLPTTLVLHEFFPYCPALYATFGSPCQRCDAQRLGECRRDNPRNAFFPEGDDRHWLAIRDEFLRLVCDGQMTVVAPSHSVVQRYVTLEPRLGQRRIEVIPHGLDSGFAAQLQGVHVDRGVQRRLSVVVLGRLTEEKGGDLLREVLDPLAAIADVWLLGTGESGSAFQGKPGVTVLPRYDRSELAGLLQQAGADLGLLLSTVPETFSYTLSELHAAAVPVVATRLGAFAERVLDDETGWLVDPAAESVLARLRAIDADRASLARVSRRLADCEPVTTTAMVEAYAALEPAGEGIPLQRYRLPRRTWWRGDAGVSAEGEPAAIHVNPQLPYRRALAEFLSYSAGRASQSPALPALLQRALSAVFRGLARIASGGG